MTTLFSHGEKARQCGSQVQFGLTGMDNFQHKPRFYAASPVTLSANPCSIVLSCSTPSSII